jgi:hypothetical protein
MLGQGISSQGRLGFKCSPKSKQINVTAVEHMWPKLNFSILFCYLKITRFSVRHL